MKTSIFTTALLTALITLSSSTFATKTKSLKPIVKSSVELNLSQFCNYLENGSPKAAEGVYTSPDGRYVIALVKNNEKEHDYIGIVCAADNSFWKKGEIKFNFVLSDSTELNGYYYNSKGDYVPVNFTIDGDSLKTNKLIKVDIDEIRAGTLAYYN
ncbi:MAG: hypothetical protein JKY48_00165 [Flavobacteriales bacterium]|nr:hypothetical protein [Flavobacteriales bacterium]